MGFFKDLKKRAKSIQPMPAPIPQEMSLPSINPGFLDKRIKSARSLPERPSPIPQEMSLNPISIPSSKLEKRISDELRTARLPEITENIGRGAMAPDRFMPGGGLGPLPRRLPRIIPERMPSRMPPPRFPDGGLRNIFARLPINMMFMDERRDFDQRARERMSPPLPRAPLPMPMPEDMPRNPFMFMRPGFANGTPEGLSKREIMKQKFLRDRMLESRDDFRRQSNMRRLGVPSAFIDPPNRDRMISSDVDVMIAEQAARKGISPAERRTQSIKQFLADSGRTISNRDAELFGMGLISFEELMKKAESARQNALTDQGRTLSMMDRNLMQQEQMFFPQSESLDDILEDLEKKN
tara:strand:- start:2249 stop:3307 length:1059 start_codon:yes stop_codon:yes gene_type:complete